MNEQTTMPAPTTSEARLPAVFGRLRDEIDQLFDDFSFAHPMRSVFQFSNAAGFNPAVELKDRKDHYELAVELPGMQEKDIDIEFADGVLSISGEKSEETEEKSDDYLICERNYGSFRRRLTLPADVDPDSIDAKYRHGVLKIEIKKDKQAVDRIRKIPVG